MVVPETFMTFVVSTLGADRKDKPNCHRSATILQQFVEVTFCAVFEGTAIANQIGVTLNACLSQDGSDLVKIAMSRRDLIQYRGVDMPSIME